MQNESDRSSVDPLDEPENRNLLGKLAQNSLVAKYRERSWWKTENFLIAAAICAGIFSAILSQSSREAFQENLEKGFQTQLVVVAAKELPAGSPLTKSVLGPGRMLKGSMTSNLVPVDNLSLVIGRTTAIDLRPGDPILLSAVSGAQNAERMAEKVPAGKRLFTLTITDRSAGLGFVKPNDHVDIIAHMELPGRGPVTFTVMQDVSLVSVGASSVLGAQGLGGTDVSFFVDPEEFEVLSYAQMRGKFSLSLRNPNDASKRDVGRGIDLNAFLDNRRISGASGGGELEVIEAGKKANPTGNPKK